MAKSPRLYSGRICQRTRCEQLVESEVSDRTGSTPPVGVFSVCHCRSIPDGRTDRSIDIYLDSGPKNAQNGFNLLNSSAVAVVVRRLIMSVFLCTMYYFCACHFFE